MSKNPSQEELEVLAERITARRKERKEIDPPRRNFQPRPTLRQEVTGERLRLAGEGFSHLQGYYQ